MGQVPKEFSGFRQAAAHQIKHLFRADKLRMHLWAWLASIALHFIYYWILTFKPEVAQGKANLSLQTDLKVFFPCLVPAAVLNYTYLLLIVPLVWKAMKRRIVWVYFGVEALIICCLLYFTIDTPYWNTVVSILSLVVGLQTTFFSFFYFWDIYDKQQVLTDYQLILEQRNEAESRFLNEQVNPHFLFNTLNNIYSLTFQDRKKARASIEKMLSMIGYIQHESTSSWVDIQTEIEFLKSYLNLELLRYKDDNVRLIFEVDGQLEGVYIAPLILINFVENAFKHGIKAQGEKSYINIRIDVYEKQLVFVIKNRKRKVRDSMDIGVGGIGLSNVRRRLELIYGRDYDLSIRDKKDLYEVKLILGKIRDHA